MCFWKVRQKYQCYFCVIFIFLIILFPDQLDFFGGDQLTWFAIRKWPTL